jgi:hypothetical protein
MNYYLRIRFATVAARRLLSTLGVEAFPVDEDSIVLRFDREEARDDLARRLDAYFRNVAGQDGGGVTRSSNLVDISDDGADFEPFALPTSTSAPILLSRLPDTPTMTTAVSTSCRLLEPVIPDCVCNIYSLGFEFQSSDLFTVVIRYVEAQDAFVCCYANPVDIPENTPVPLHRVKTACVGVQLDAVPLGGEDHQSYINSIEQTLVTLPEDKGRIGMIECSDPQDTEFVILDTDRESMLYFEPDKENPNPLELIKNHFDLHCVSLIHWHLGRDAWVVHQFTTPFPSLQCPVKYNVLRIMSPLVRQNGSRTVGFVSHGLRVEDAHRISFVPQVTFSCDLLASFNILTKLLAGTSDNRHLPLIRRAHSYARSVCGTAHTEIRSFLFLLTYYLRIMGEHSKQELGIALRHRFAELFNDLSQTDRELLFNITGGAIEMMLTCATTLEASDGIHRYPYGGNKVILIEYRLFNYVVSPEGATILTPMKM